MWDLATEPEGTMRRHPGTRGPPPCAHHCHARWGCRGSGRLSDHKKPQDSLISSVRRARLWGRAAENAPEGGRSKLGARLLPTYLDSGRDASTDSVKLPLYCGCFDNSLLPGVAYSGFKYT